MASLPIARLGHHHTPKAKAYDVTRNPSRAVRYREFEIHP